MSSKTDDTTTEGNMCRDKIYSLETRAGAGTHIHGRHVLRKVTPTQTEAATIDEDRNGRQNDMQRIERER